MVRDENVILADEPEMLWVAKARVGINDTDMRRLYASALGAGTNLPEKYFTVIL